MNRPLVSVIMPTYNEERAVKASIDSVLRQTERSWELLIIDGRSTDRTKEIVQELALADDRIRLLDNPAGIIPAGLNVGLTAAEGEFIARIDGHSIVAPDHLARGIGHLRARRDLAAVGGLRVGVARTSSGRAIALALSSRFGVGNSVIHYGDSVQDTDHAAWGVYRRDVARDIGGWDEALLVNEDVDFDHRIGLQGHAILFDPAMKIDWQVRESLSGLWRQYRRYGRGKAAMVRKNGWGAVRLRHLAAPGLVVAGVVGLGAAVVGAWPVPVGGSVVYLTAVGLASKRAVNRTDEAIDVWVVPAAFVAMHVGWGIGFLEGVLLGRQPARSS